MAPLRSSRASNRANRGQTEHDVMDGLPVRQWERQLFKVHNTPQKEAQAESSEQDTIWRELPMPKGSEHYAPWSREILRAARAGLILKTQQKPAEEDKEGGDDEDGEGEPDPDFFGTKWTQLPREMERPEPMYLANRRKGLSSLYGASSNVPIAALRETKVRRIDPNGNPYVYKVLVPEGSVIEGEVVNDEDTTTQAPAPGTVIEGVGVTNSEGVVVAGEQVAPTPPRRRPPPPKRKPKGPGRGRKKKVVIENAADSTTSAVGIKNLQTNGSGLLDGKSNAGQGGHGEEASDAGVGDESVLQGDEGSEDEDEEGEEGDDADREEGELTDTEDQLSRSATPSKPPTINRAKSPTKTNEIGASSYSSSTTNENSKASYLAPPSISVQPSMDTLAAPMDAAPAPVSGLLQPSLGPSSTPSSIGTVEKSIAMDEPTSATAASDPQSAQDLNEDLTSGATHSSLEGLQSSMPVVTVDNSDANDLSLLQGAADPVNEPSRADVATQPLAPTLQATSAPIVEQSGMDVALSVEGHAAGPIDVEAPTNDPNATVAATISEAHNPLEGLSEPQLDQQSNNTTTDAIMADVSDQTAPAENTADVSPGVHMADQATSNDDDIFGSLERHLQSKSG